MSLIKLQGNASGTGAFTIAAPNGNTDRTLTLPDATGTVNVSGLANEVPAGSAGAPAIYPTGDSNTGIFFPAADTIAFSKGGVEAARFDSSGNLLVGLTDGDSRLGNNHLNINGFISCKNSSIPTGNMGGVVAFGGSTGAPIAGRVYFGDATGWQWNWGSVLNGAFTQKFTFNDAGGAFNLQGTWGSLSDARLKENIVDATPKLNDLMSLRVRNFNFISDPGQKQLGFIAQEIEEVFPGLVDTPKPDENGVAIKAVKISVLVPMLVKAMQEQQAQIEDLKAEVAALKGASA